LENLEDYILLNLNLKFNRLFNFCFSSKIYTNLKKLL
jgi:hypothetical protein